MTENSPNSINNSGTGGNPDILEADLAQRLVLIRNQFQEQQTSLLMQYQQHYAQLAMQHLQDSQAIVADFLRQAQPGSGDPNDPSTSSRERNPSDNSNHGPSSESTTGKTISVKTKEKLKDMIYSKHKIPRPPIDNGLFSPQQYSPYPRMYHGVGFDQSSNSMYGNDTELRKATSEPNLKIKGVQALRAKLIERQQRNRLLSQQASTTTSITETTSQSMGSNESNSRTTAFFATPSMPNMAGPRIEDLTRQALAYPMAGLDAVRFLSAPALQRLAPPPMSSFDMLLRQATAGANPAATAASLPSESQQQPPSSSSFTMTDASGTASLLDQNAWLAAAAAAAASCDPAQQVAGGSLSFPLPFGQFNLLHSQIRDLVLRRKSLVREETEEDVRKEGNPFSLMMRPETATQLQQQQFDMNPITSMDSSATAVTSNRSIGRRRTGLTYDSTMCRHQCTCGDNGKHVEHGGRIHSIWARLHETGLAEECEKILSRKAPLDYMRICHASNYCTFFGVSPTACLKVDPAELPLKSFIQLPCGGIGVDSDTYFNDTFTPAALRAAVGCAVELCLAIAEGRVQNGFAIVRPPGHHAEPNQALGFCFFNNVAISAKIMQQKMSGSGTQACRIAIIDWDVHHGNGTQLIFENDPSVLYLSIHRHDDGNFFPGTGAAEETGSSEGVGFTINIPWSGEMMGDAEYLAAWRCIVAPVLDQFNPDAIIVSCGFDAAEGHWNAVGGYHVSSWMFGWMTSALTKYAGGRVALVLEGGYNLAAISDAAESCVRALLATPGRSSTAAAASEASAPSGANDVCALNESATSFPDVNTPQANLAAIERQPNASARATLARVACVQRAKWPGVNGEAALVSHRRWLASIASTNSVANTNAHGSNLRSQFENLAVGSAAAASGTACDDRRVMKRSPHSSLDEEENGGAN